MALGDLFLPVASTVEHDGIVLPHFGRNTHFLGAMNKALQVGECKSDLEIDMLVGKRLNPGGLAVGDRVGFLYRTNWHSIRLDFRRFALDGLLPARFGLS